MDENAADNLRSSDNDEYRSFKEETEALLADAMGAGSEVVLMDIDVGTSRRALQAMTVDGQYRFIASEGTSRAAAKAAVDNVLEQLNNDAVFFSEGFRDRFQVSEVSAADTTPTSTDSPPPPDAGDGENATGALCLGWLGMLQSSALGATLLLLVL